MDEFGKGLLIGFAAGVLAIVLIMAFDCGIGEGACKSFRGWMCTVPHKIPPNQPYH